MNKNRIISAVCAAAVLLTSMATGLMAIATPNIIQPSGNTTTFDFDDGIQRLRGRIRVDDPQKLHYIRMDVPAYSIGCFRFEYQLKPNKTYKIAYDYKTNSAARATPFNFVSQTATFSDAGFEEGTAGNQFRAAHLLYDAPVTAGTEWQRVEGTFTTTDAMLANGSDYLAFGFKAIWDAVEFCMDNISITEMPDGLNAISVSDFETGDTPVYHALGGMDYKTENDNRFFNLSGTSSYQQFPFRTKHELKPDTKYEISFKFKNNSNGGLNQGLYLMAGNSVNDWNFYTTGDNPKEKNILGTKPNTNASINIHNDNTEWTERKVVVDTATTKAVDGTFKYLSFYCQTAEGSKFDISFDDVVVTEIGDTYETKGFLILNDNKGSELTYASDTVGATVQLPNPAAQEGCEFTGWYTDKTLKNKFDGIMTVGTNMLYAGYVAVDNGVYDFNDPNKTYISNAQNAIVKDGYLSMQLGEYSIGFFRLNYQLKPNQTYRLSYKYKMGDYALQAPPTFMSQNATFNDADFDNTPAGEAARSKYKLHQISVGAGTEWISGEETFTTNSTNITDDRNYLAFGLKKAWTATEFCLDDIVITAVETPNYKVGNFDFNDPNKTHVYNAQNAVVKEGYLSMTTDEYAAGFFRLDYKLKPNKTYKISYDYKIADSALQSPFTFMSQKQTFLDTDFQDTVEGKANREKYKLHQIESNVKLEWTKGVGTFTTTAENVTDERNYLAFGFKKAWTKAEFCIDNIVIIELSDEELASSVVNGGFEYGMTYWTDDAKVSELSSDAKEGNSSLKMSGGYYKKVYQVIEVKPDTNYKLKFYYKGKSSGIPNWAISHTKISTENKYTLQKGSFANNEGWTEVSVVVSSGNYKSLIVMFQSDLGSDFLIDDISAVVTTEAATEKAAEKSPLVVNGKASAGVNIKFICDDADNLLTDYGFEGNEGNWNQQSLFGSGNMQVVKSDAARYGNNVLKFSAEGKDADTWSTMYVDVEPNTVYYLTACVKGEYWSDTNKNDMRFGIVDSNTGYFIGTQNNNIRFTPTNQLNIGAWDNEWHLVDVAFNSGSATKIGIGFRGGNSVAYFDNMYMFKESDRVEYIPTIQQGKVACEITNTEPSLLGCNDNDNLMENYNLSDASSNFWQSALSYDLTAAIASTGSTKGNALYYKSNDNITGYPMQTYYIKWIDVEPNTEYTFSADYNIIKAGGGYFGFINGNQYRPTEIMRYNFDDEHFNEDFRWQKSAFSFNTKGYSRIGFFICDFGGEGYVDNLRLFKTSAGRTLEEKDDFPKIITSGTQTINGDVIGGINAGTTIGDILNALNEKEYIRVFKDGIEITDYNQIAGTGIEYRLMDGPTIYNRLTTVVPGDVNGDGRSDSGDIDDLLKYLTKTKELSKFAKMAAGADSDDDVNIDDIVIMLMVMNDKRQAISNN